uniref:Egg protein CP391S-like protein n=1 Tax=Schistosoma mansoni TaxID=6183 RepID=A0AA82N7Z2_SCHMA
MRYNFYSDISISFYLVVVLLYKCLQCQDVCQQPDLLQYEKVIYVNKSYLYSHHYNYTMRITLNQPNPVFNENLLKSPTNEEVKPNFQFKYYESQVNNFNVYSYGTIDIQKVIRIGQIDIFILGEDGSEVQVLNEKDLFAARWSIKKNDNSKLVKGTVFCLIYPSGKISIYYEDIPTEINRNLLYSKMRGIFWCQTSEVESRITIPIERIKSGTLVEYEPMGESCAKYNTSESCQNARPSDIACIWCDKNNTCIDIYYQDTDYLKENNCRVKHTTDGITEENGQNKSLQYLYIVIPLVVSFFALCIGCVIWRWLYMKKKRNL